MPNSFMVVKSNGDREPFDVNKIKSSLARARAPKQSIDDIVYHIENELIDGIHTADIYRHAFDLLKSRNEPAAARYSLRRAILEFGPTGFPFEKFIAEIFRAQGYSAVTGQMIKGKCVEHEVDIVAWKDDKATMVEAKFHNVPGLKSDLKVALYVKARFDDLHDSLFDYDGSEKKFHEGILITNTKFSTKAIEYGECQKLKMVGWNYPEKGNLEDLIIETGLHPLTCLTTLSRAERGALLNSGLVLCKDIVESKNSLLALGVTRDNVERVVREATTILGS